MANVLMVIAPEGYQDIEYETPKEVLENAGHTVKTTSTVENPQGGLGGNAHADFLLNEARADDFDAVVFVGGPGAHLYFNDKTAHNLVKSFYNEGKLTCAICAAPSILANVGILKDKNATSFPSHEENLKNKGANFTGAPVEQDQNVITASGPTAAKAFGEAINQALR
jgi:protease I